MSIAKGNYIPGFDWFRIIGSILVVATHLSFFRYFLDNMNTAYKVLSEGIPVFFIISGYLAGRQFSKKRIFGQIIRYGIPYLVIVSGVQVLSFIRVYMKTGEAHFQDLITNILCCFMTVHTGYIVALWFIRVLIFAFLLNIWMTPNIRKIAIILLIVLRTIFVFLGADTMTAESTGLLERFSLWGRVLEAEDVYRGLNHFLTGLLFTTVGFDITTWKAKPIHMLIVGLLFAMFEVFVCYLNIAVVFLSIALFYGIKELPGQFLRPFHMEISLFSVFMYFLHMFEKGAFYRCGVKNRVISFALIIITNALLTFLTAYVIKNRGKRVSIARGAV